MNHTTNYNFNLPTDDDFYDIAQQNENWSSLDATLKEIEDSDDAVAFKLMYGLCNKTTSITPNAQHNKVITETDSDTSIQAVTTIVKTSSTVTTITCVVTDGSDEYTKVTTITKSGSGTTIAESYSKTN